MIKKGQSQQIIFTTQISLEFARSCEGAICKDVEQDHKLRFKKQSIMETFCYKKPANYKKESLQTRASKEDTKKQIEHSYLSENQSMSSNKKTQKQIKQQQKHTNTNFTIQYCQSNAIPYPQAISRQQMRYYKYYINQMESKVYFYPFASKIFWNYVELKQQPNFDDNRYQGFVKQMEAAACQYYSDPIFVVSLETAKMQLQKLKKQNKYQGKIYWKSHAKEMAKMDQEYRKNYVIPRYQDIFKN